MKRVISISMGSSSRDHTTEAEFLGENFQLSRRGTDGDIKAYFRELAKWDGRVDGIGLGGMEFYVMAGRRKYYLREAKQVWKVVKQAHVGDGNGIKSILAPLALQTLVDYGFDLKGKKALKTSAVDRWGMAQALVDFGCQVTFGDLMFILGWNIPIHSLRTVKLLASFIAPGLVQLPFTWLYPLGSAQDKEPSTKFASYYEEADIIAGDFIHIWSSLPDELTGKVIITNTTTSKNVAELQKRNLHILVTTTPRLNGRSFGTNVMETVLRVLIDKPYHQVTDNNFRDLMQQVGLKPELHVLNA
jgi:hypothetical protein